MPREYADWAKRIEWLQCADKHGRNSVHAADSGHLAINQPDLAKPAPDSPADSAVAYKRFQRF